MTIRWTKRPQNTCRTCHNTWYPRGKSLSDRCPRCGSPEVEFIYSGCLRAIFYLLASPFILIGFLLQAIVTAVIFLVSGVASVLWSLVRLVARTVTGSARAGGTAVKWSADKAVPVGGWLVDRSRPLLSKAGEWLRVAGRHAIAGIVFVARWVASAKNDLLGEGEREVNPISLIAKLLTFVLVSIVAIVLVIKLFRGVFSVWNYFATGGTTT